METQSRFSQIFSEGSLGRKILSHILFFSTLITFLMTFLQLYIDYRNGVNGLSERFDEIKATHLESLGRNLWHLNNEQIQIHLNGILQKKDIVYLEIQSSEGENFKVGKIPATSNIIRKNYEIVYHDLKNKRFLGNLLVIGNLQNIYNEIQNRTLIILVSQATKTFLVSLFILYIFYTLVGKHLSLLAGETEKFSLDDLGRPFKLERPNSAPSPDEIDKVVNALNSMREKIQEDILKRKIIESQLRQSQKMEALGTLAGGIAHDFNNIIQGIMNALSLMEDEAGENSSFINKIHIALSLTERGRDLVKQILIYSKQEEGKFSPMSISSTLRDVGEMIRSTKPKEIEFKLNAEVNLGKIEGDKTQIGQVLVNLITNSIQAFDQSETGVIQLSANKRKIHVENKYQLPKGDYVEILVSDNGQGMSDEVQSRIFEPFFTTKKVGQGTGLGLSVVHGIVENHGGIIDVSSVLNEGTTFNILLPLLKDSQSDDLYTGEELILLIDDDKDFLDIILDDVQSLGHPTLTAHDATEAMELFKTNRDQISLVITDLNLGKGINGIDLSKEFRQIEPKVPIILLTGYFDSQAHVTEDIDLKVLEKPHSLEGLSRTIRKLIRENQSN